MGLIVGLVGLPNVGKSSLFNSLTKGKALVANYPFATIEPNLGVVDWVDERVTKLSKLIDANKTTHTSIKFLDIAGLVKGSSVGEGLGNKFLEHIRGVDLICQVVRCFNDENIFRDDRTSAVVNPIEDFQLISLELIYADVQLLEKMKTKDPKTNALNNELLQHLRQEKPLRTMKLDENKLRAIKGYRLLTLKPVLVLGNVNDDLTLFNKLNDYTPSFALDVRKSDNFPPLIKKVFEFLKLRVFFTFGKQEVKSWSFVQGSTAKECAALIHTDISDRFIKAGVVKYTDLITYNSIKMCKVEGKFNFEGKNYLMQEGDVVHFEFNK